MARILEKEKAQKMRKQGRSIRDITKTLGVSKSTVSYWCRDIVLSPKQKKKLYDSQKTKAVAALLRASEERREKRLRDTKLQQSRGRNDVGKLTKRDLFMIGLALYWGEGYKKGNQETGFTNSDPEIIQVFIRWLKEIYGIKKDKLILRVSINKLHRSRVKSVLEYWSKTTSVPLSQFTKTSLIKTQAKKQYKNHDKHFGTLRVKVRNGTSLRRQILGSISVLK